MNSNSFKEEIDDAINDIGYGVESVELINNHPLSDNSNQIAIIKVQTKDNINLLIKMSLYEGFSIIIENSNNTEDKISFDSLPNLLMHYSPEFQNQFSLKLFERLSNISNK